MEKPSEPYYTPPFKNFGDQIPFSELIKDGEVSIPVFRVKIRNVKKEEKVPYEEART